MGNSNARRVTSPSLMSSPWKALNKKKTILRVVFKKQNVCFLFLCVCVCVLFPPSFRFRVIIVPIHLYRWVDKDDAFDEVIERIKVRPQVPAWHGQKRNGRIVLENSRFCCCVRGRERLGRSIYWAWLVGSDLLFLCDGAWRAWCSHWRLDPLPKSRRPSVARRSAAGGVCCTRTSLSLPKVSINLQLISHAYLSLQWNPTPHFRPS